MQKISNPKKSSWGAIVKRPTIQIDDVESTVSEVFNEVRSKGDLALDKYTSLFDGVQLKEIQVSESEIQQANKQVGDSLKEAINVAKNNILAFHSAQKTPRVEVQTTDGVHCWQEKRPIEKVGLYIPGGTAPLFSTILMLAIPAQLAGCSEVILCTPPDKQGNVNPAILYTAALCGVKTIFKVGGIQAIAAMTFGTKTIPGVYKIFGPGNQFVTVAKQYATRYNVAIDMPAGPSELLIVADQSSNPAYVASDLLSQAEHGVDSQVILVSTDSTTIDKVQQELEKQLEDLPRKAIASKAIENSRFIYFDAEQNALEFINTYGPEHFIIASSNEEFYVDGVRNAGSVFIGKYTPESAGDYASGTNHTLPTNGYAKQYSGVNLDSFLKSITFQKISEQGIKNIGSAIELMAEAEGLFAHKNAVSIRLKDLN